MIKINRRKMQELNNKLIIIKEKSEIKLYLANNQNTILEYKYFDINDNILGGIYLGIVEHVNYSLSVIFVKIKNRNGFLSFKNLNPLYYENNKIKLKKNDPVIVEIIKEAVDHKLLSLTTFISISGKYCIYLPYSLNNNGISQKIKGSVRNELKQFVQQIKAQGSLIVRTNSYNIDFDDIYQDYLKLKKIFYQIIKSYTNSNQIKLLYQNDLLTKYLHSYTPIVDQILYNNRLFVDSIQNNIENNNIALIYTKEFDSKLEKNILDIERSIISLPSGGEIVFQKTEACIVIDVNSKSCKAKKDAAENIYIVNKEAAIMIGQQIILKNIGGMIIIDFIDMKNIEYINEINRIIKQSLKNDKCSNKILPYNEFGIMQISRQKIGVNIMDQISSKCSKCSRFISK